MKFLKFSLGEDMYGIDIDNVNEITKMSEITRVPNSSPEVEGVMDLRGNTTSILNPKKLFDIESNGNENRIIILDSKDTGWIVDEVYNVLDIDTENIDKAVTKKDSGVQGIIKKNGEFIVLVEPYI